MLSHSGYGGGNRLQRGVGGPLLGLMTLLCLRPSGRASAGINVWTNLGPEDATVNSFFE